MAKKIARKQKKPTRYIAKRKPLKLTARDMTRRNAFLENVQKSMPAVRTEIIQPTTTQRKRILQNKTLISSNLASVMGINATTGAPTLHIGVPAPLGKLAGLKGDYME